MTNPTPDTALAARLLELSVKSTQDPLNEDGRYFNGDWHNDLTQCSHGDTGNYSNRRDGQFIADMWNAFREGQLITRTEADAMVLAERGRVLSIMRIGSADVDRLRLVAFSSNAERDKFNYHNACAKWFNERHFRELETAAIRTEPRP